MIRRAPGRDAVHVVDEHDVRRFVRLIDDWPELSRGLKSIVLERYDEGSDGHCRYDGSIALYAWSRDLVRDVGGDYYADHQEVFARIGVPCEANPSPAESSPVVRCWFDRSTARAYTLMHIFLHELGHHVDRMTSERCETGTRGEEFAEAWAIGRELALWPRYLEYFGRRP